MSELNLLTKFILQNDDNKNYFISLLLYGRHWVKCFLKASFNLILTQILSSRWYYNRWKSENWILQVLRNLQKVLLLPREHVNVEYMSVLWKNSALNQGSVNVFCKDQIGNTLGFLGHTVSATATQLFAMSCNSSQRQHVNNTYACISTKLYLNNRWLTKYSNWLNLKLF